MADTTAPAGSPLFGLSAERRSDLVSVAVLGFVTLGAALRGVMAVQAGDSTVGAAFIGVLFTVSLGLGVLAMAAVSLKASLSRAYTIALYGFLYLPVVVLILFSFNNAVHTAQFEGLTTRWYEEALNDEAAWRAAIMSLKLSVATVVTSVSLGTLAAVGLRYTSARLQRFVWPLLLMPIVLPEIAMAVAFLRLYGALHVELGFVTVWLSHVAFSISYVIVVVQARLQGMDHALEEAAADLGAPPVTAFFKVTLPQLVPAVASAAMLVFALSIDDYVITSFVAGVGNTTVPVYVYGLFRKKITPEIHAISTLLLSVTTPLIIGSWVLENRDRKS